MGRSVMTPRDSAYDLYFDISADEGCEQEYWDDTVAEIKDRLATACPSFCAPYYRRRWEHGREVETILTNSHADVTVSVYGAIACLSVVPRRDQDTNGEAALAASWCEKVRDKVERIVDDVAGPLYSKVGSMSNGEGVFMKA